MTTTRFDRWVTGRLAIAVAFLWGCAEATCFFIVPDVLLTFLACFRPRAALRACLAALAGSLVGGGIMVALGDGAPETARSLLSGIPGIDAGLIAGVRSELDRLGLTAVLLGPTKGIPYKIYAVEWGARGGGLIPFLLISIPARYVRFFLATLLAAGIARAVAGGTGRRALAEGTARRAVAGSTTRRTVTLALWSLFWTALYVAYFRGMGW